MGIETYSEEVTQKYEGILADWSRQGSTYGRHVKFPDDANFKMPNLGNLGNGAFGKVVKTYCPYQYRGIERRCYVARKKYINGAMLDEEMWREISIQKRLRHQHVLELVGSYELKGKFIALFWPVAPFTLCNILDAVKHVGQALSHPASSETYISRETVLAEVPHDTDLGRGLSTLAELLPSTTDKAPKSYSVQEIVHETIRRLFAALGCLAEALRYISAQKVRHRDLKPQNILIFPSEDRRHDCGQNDPNAKDVPIKDGLRIGDFGLAKGHGNANLSYTWTDTVAGTPLYNSPEEAARGQSGPEADVFSLGCIFLEILCALSLEHVVRDPAQKFCSRQDLNLSLLGYAHSLHRFDEWIVLLHETGESQVQEHLISLVGDMMSMEPSNRPDAKQVTTRLAMMEQLRTKGAGDNVVGLEEATHSLFGGCCKPVRFRREDYRLLRQIYPGIDPVMRPMPVPPAADLECYVTATNAGSEDVTCAMPGLKVGAHSLRVERGMTQRAEGGLPHAIMWNGRQQRIDPRPPPYVPDEIATEETNVTSIIPTKPHIENSKS